MHHGQIYLERIFLKTYFLVWSHNGPQKASKNDAKQKSNEIGKKVSTRIFNHALSSMHFDYQRDPGVDAGGGYKARALWCRLRRIVVMPMASKSSSSTGSESSPVWV